MDEEELYDEFGNYIGPELTTASGYADHGYVEEEEERDMVEETGDRFAMVTVEEGTMATYVMSSNTFVCRETGPSCPP